MFRFALLSLVLMSVILVDVEGGRRGGGRKHHGSRHHGSKHHGPKPCTVTNSTSDVIFERNCTCNATCEGPALTISRGSDSYSASFCRKPEPFMPSVKDACFVMGDEKNKSRECLVGLCDAGPIVIEAHEENVTAYFCGAVPTEPNFAKAVVSRACYIRTSAGVEVRNKSMCARGRRPCACPLDGVTPLSVTYNGVDLEVFFCSEEDYDVLRLLGAGEKKKQGSGSSSSSSSESSSSSSESSSSEEDDDEDCDKAHDDDDDDDSDESSNSRPAPSGNRRGGRRGPRRGRRDADDRPRRGRGQRQDSDDDDEDDATDESDDGDDSSEERGPRDDSSEERGPRGGGRRGGRRGRRPRMTTAAPEEEAPAEGPSDQDP